MFLRPCKIQCAYFYTLYGSATTEIGRIVQPNPLVQDRINGFSSLTRILSAIYEDG